MTYSLLPQVEIIDGVAVTTSRDIAKHFGKEHYNVLRSIQCLECSEEFTKLNFEVCYENSELQNGKPLLFYRITKDGFFFLVMGFTGKEAARIKEAYIDAFNQMEKYLREPVQPHLKDTDSTDWMNRDMELEKELLHLYCKQIVQRRRRGHLTFDLMDEMRFLYQQGSSPTEIAEFVDMMKDCYLRFLSDFLSNPHPPQNRDKRSS